MKNNLLKGIIAAFLGVSSISLSIAAVANVKEEGAMAYYTNGDAATYYNTLDTSKDGTAFLSDLRSLNLSRRKSTVGYSAMGTSASGMFKYTDYDPDYVQYDSNGQPYGTQILSFYSGISTTSFNREHVWPNSRGGGSNGGAGSPYPDADIFMPRPTINAENSDRGNSVYYEGMTSSSAGWDPVAAFEDSMGVYENIRGECARIIFYCMTVNANLVLNENTSNERNNMGKLTHLLRWNLQYPVNQREINRNEGGEYLQGNRNAFVDHPEYACKIWGDTSTETRSICASYSGNPTSITLTPSATSIAVGAKATIKATVDKGSSSVTWTSSNTNVATVNNGTVTGIGTGTTVITATSTADTSVKASVTITVKAVNSISKTGNPTNTTYTAGESFDPTGLTVTAVYSDGTTANVTSDVVWSPDPLTVGTTSVTGTYAGKTVTVTGLTVSVASGYKIVFKDSGSDGSSVLSDSSILSDYITEGADKVSSISSATKVYAGTTGLKLGSSSATGSFTINLKTATQITGLKVTTKKYGSDTGNVVVKTDFDAAGKTITPSSTLAATELSMSGTTSTITIGTSSKRAYISSVEIMTGDAPTTVSVTGVSLNKNTLSLDKGTSETLTATVAPSNATNKNVTWTSNNTTVATVDNGVVTAKAAGTATITVKTEDGNKTASCTVTVAEASVISVTSVTLNKNTLSLEKGSSETLTATVMPSNATNKNVTWTSNNTDVATVNNGVVTAVAAGTATITVKTEDGNKTASCTVTVTNPVVPPTPIGETTVEISTFADISGDLDENISYEATQGDATSAPAVFSGIIRVYQNGGLFTVTANNGTKITSITLGSAMTTTVKYQADDNAEVTGVNIAENDTIDVVNLSADQVVFTCMGTSKTTRLYVNYLKVTYSSNSSTPDYEAEAATWAATFITTVSCDNGATAPSKSSWNTVATSYASLSDGAKALFISATYTIAGSGSSTVVNAGTDVNEDVAKAVAKYDYIIVKYGTTNYSNFISRTISAANITNKLETESQSVSTIAVVISALTLTSFTLFLIYRKRKTN